MKTSVSMPAVAVMSWTSSNVSSRASTTRVKAEPVQRLGAGAVVDGQLRAGVQFQLGEVLADAGDRRPDPA